MERKDMVDLIRIGSELGYTKARIDLGDLRPYMNKTEAEKKYGPGLLDEWINEDNPTVIPIYGKTKNSMIRFDRIQLEIRAAASNVN